MEQYVTHSERETIDLGREFSARLIPGSVVAIVGELGAGKTRFVQGICGGLGITGHVASPTFTLVHEYRGRTGPVYHFDLYRLRSLDEAVEFGFEEYFRTEAICLLEWAEKVERLLPPLRFQVALRLGDDSSTREITIREAGVIAA
jgi:tRNA threonylcarbamoyladenosine biosynthesis protein TsaE